MTEDKEQVTGPEIQVHDAIMEVRTTVLGQEEVSQKRLRIRPFVSAHATVSVKAGFTKNLGNYESMRVDVMAVMPCYPEEVDEAYNQVKDWVDARIGDLYDKAENKKIK
jgi:hypothetical protein